MSHTKTIYKVPSTWSRIFFKPHTFFTRISLPSTRPHRIPFYTSLVIQGYLNPFLIQKIIYKAPSTLIRIFLKSRTFLHESTLRTHKTAYLFTRSSLPSTRNEIPLLHESASRRQETTYCFTRISFPSTRNSIPFYTISAFRPHETAYSFTRISLPSTRNRIPFYTSLVIQGCLYPACLIQNIIYKAPSTRIRIFLKLHTVHTFLHESTFRPHEEITYLFTRSSLPSTRNRILFYTNR